MSFHGKKPEPAGKHKSMYIGACRRIVHRHESQLKEKEIAQYLA